MKKISILAKPNPPYLYIEQDQTLTGMDSELIHSSLRIAGYEAEMIPLEETASEMDLLENNKVDGIYCCGSTNSSQEGLVKSQPVRIVKLAVINRTEEPCISTTDEIIWLGLAVGVTKENFHVVGQSHLSELSLSLYEQESQMMSDLVSGRLDACILDPVKNACAIQKQDLRINKISDLDLKRSNEIIFNCDNVALCEAFNLGLMKLIETNQYFEISRHWHSKPSVE